MLTIKPLSIYVTQVNLKTPNKVSQYNCDALVPLKMSFFNSHPMIVGSCERWTFLLVGFEELVCEMLSEEGKHKTGALRVWDELSSH